MHLYTKYHIHNSYGLLDIAFNLIVKLKFSHRRRVVLHSSKILP